MLVYNKDFFKFTTLSTAKEGNSISVTSLTIDNQTMDHMITLYDQEANEIAKQDTLYAQEELSMVDVAGKKLPKGIYYLVVQHWNQKGSGAYTISYNLPEPE